MDHGYGTVSLCIRVGELELTLSSCSKQRQNERSSMILHLVLVWKWERWANCSLGKRLQRKRGLLPTSFLSFGHSNLVLYVAHHTHSMHIDLRQWYESIQLHRKTIMRFIYHSLPLK